MYEKVDVTVFASICLLCFYIYIFNQKNKFKKKHDKEVEEAIRNYLNHDDTSKKKCVGKE